MISITGSTVIPSSGGTEKDFVEQSFSISKDYQLTQSDQVLIFDSNLASGYNITAANYSIAGFTNTNSRPVLVYDGMPILLTNKTTNVLHLRHLFELLNPSQFAFNIRENVGVDVPIGETILFKLELATNQLVEVFRSWSKFVLKGTQYVFVQANGTDVENATELQIAYNLAKTQASVAQILSAPYNDPFQANSTMLGFYDYTTELPILIQGESYIFIVDGFEMIGQVIYGDGYNYDVEFPPFTYLEGEVRVISNEIVRSTVIAAPGNYNFTNGNFIMDSEYVDLVSLDGNRSILFNSKAYSIDITANNVFVKGVDVLYRMFSIGNDLPKLKVENCKGEGGSFGIWWQGKASSTFIDCVGGDYSFGGRSTASGTFINCKGGDYSFGGTASGTFIDCVGGDSCFGSEAYTFPTIFIWVHGIASGTFTNCVAGWMSFGCGGSRTQLDPEGNFESVRHGGTSSGIFTNCVAGRTSFGLYGNASGTFINCSSEENSFGFEGTASGVFDNCISLVFSFGYSGTASGTFNTCRGGSQSFGGGFAPLVGILRGRLYYCRLTSGTFRTVSLGGRTVLCINGNNTQNNQ